MARLRRAARILVPDRVLGSRFVIDGATTVLDAGWCCQPSPVDPLLAAADVVLVVTNGNTDQVCQGRDRLSDSYCAGAV